MPRPETSGMFIEPVLLSDVREIYMEEHQCSGKILGSGIFSDFTVLLEREQCDDYRIVIRV